MSWRHAAAAFLALGSATVAAAAEFHDEVERDFALRSIGTLHVTNLRGGIVIQGWAQDKIRVKARRRAVAPTAEEARRLLSVVDFRFRAVEGDIELSAEYGRGLGIQERLRERETPHTGMEMIVFAPSSLSLRVWSNEGAVAIKGWNAPVEVRTSSGEIRLEGARGGAVSLLCPSCAIAARGVRGSLRCVGGNGSVEVHDVSGKSVYVESTSGDIRASRVMAGEQLYVSKAGMIVGRELRGHVEFQTQRGDVDLQDGEGFLSGRTDTGHIRARMKSWRFTDKALIESVKGDIHLTLPRRFAAEVDLWSVNGKTRLGYPLEAITDSRVVGPEPANRLRGRIGDGGEQLKVHSQLGNVEVVPGI